MKKNNILPTFEETIKQREFRQKYMKAINRAYRYDESIGIMDIGEDKKVSLQDIYVPLQFSKYEYNEDNYYENDTLHSIVDLFQQNRNVVLSGKPGSGKTTLSRSIINSLSSNDLTVMSNEFGRRLPLYFKLRDYKIESIKSFEDFLNQYILTMSRILKIDIYSELVLFYLKQGWCFLIFDGVDEVGNETNRLKIRDYILKEFSKYNQNNYILVTSRPTGIENSYFFNYTKREYEQNKTHAEDRAELELEVIQESEYGEDKTFLQSIEYEENFKNQKNLKQIEYEENSHVTKKLNFPLLYHVAPFTDKQITLYSTNWFKLREENPIVISSKVDDFITSIEKIENLSLLRRRPVFLSMMIHIHTTKGKLPYSRAMAYRYMVEAYIEHIDIARRLHKLYSNDWSFEDKERVLENLAYKLHSSIIEPNNINHTSVQITLNKDELRDTIRQIIVENLEKWQTIKQGDEEELLEFYISRTGLLHEPEENKIQFSHLSFQEYLTAHYIYKKVIEKPFEIKETIEKEILSRINDTKWSEVILLFFSLYKDATNSILDQFYDTHKDSYDFTYLILLLLDSIEYGIKDSNLENWIGRTVEFISGYSEEENNSLESPVFDLIEKLFQNQRVNKNIIKDKVHTFIDRFVHMKQYSKCKNILYLASYDEGISKSMKNIIIANQHHFLDNSLYSLMELFSVDFPELTSSIFNKYPLKDCLLFYDTASFSSKYIFLYQCFSSWKCYFLKLDWWITDLYTQIELSRFLQNYSVNYTIDRYRKFIRRKNNSVNDNWTNYWYTNVWRRHRNGVKKVLTEQDIFLNRSEYYIENRENYFDFFKVSNSEMQKEIDSLRNGFGDSRTKKIGFIRDALMVLFSTKQIEQQYKLDLSIPWKTFDEFKNFTIILKDTRKLHKYLEDVLQIDIAFSEFEKEFKDYIHEAYSFDKQIDIIMKNQDFYELDTYDKVKNKILEK